MQKIEKMISLVVTLLMIFTLIQVEDTQAANEFLFDASSKTITRYEGTATDVTVPAEINGTPVENIAANAFVNNTSLVSVQLPTSLKTIGNSAFEGCTNLTTVEFSGVIENLETIGDRAFSGCTQLTVNWVIRNGHNINVTAGALQSNNHSFLMLSQTSGETTNEIDNLNGTYYQAIEEKILLGSNERLGLSATDQEFMQGYIDMSSICNLYDWYIVGTGGDQPGDQYDDQLYRLFNVPTDNSQINYRLINDPMYPQFTPTILAYIQDNKFYFNGQKPMLYGYANYSGSDREIEFVIMPNKSKANSFKIENPPLKTTYYEGEVFDPTGLVVSLKDRYDDTLYISFTTESEYFYDQLFIFNGHYSNEPIVLDANDTSINVVLTSDLYEYGILEGDSPQHYFSTSLPITVKSIYATKISVSTPPKKVNYFEGDKFDPTGLVLHVENNDGSEEDVTYDDSTKDKFSFPSDPLQTSDTEVEITYDGQKVKQEVKVSPVEISSIVVKDNPQLEYYAGDYFDSTGLTLTVHYNNGTTQDITYSEATKNEFQFSLDPLKSTDTEIRITYQNHEFSLSLTVHPLLLERIEIKQKPAKLEYYAQDNFDPSSLIITAYYNNGTNEDITYSEETQNQFSFSVSQLKASDEEVVIDYHGKKTSQRITVHPLLIDTVDIKSQPTQLEYYEEDIFNPSGLVMSIKYNSGRTKDVSYSDATKTDFIFSLNELSIDNHEIEITYQSYSFTLPITVKERYRKDKVEKDIVEIEGQFEENAYLVIENKAFHEAGNLLNDKDILGSYEVSVIGKYRGELKLTFEIGTEHNGKTVYILHQKQDGSIEKFEEVVKDGKVMITVNELSPFIIYMDKEKTDISNTENNQEVVPPVINPIEPPLSNINNELNTNKEPLTLLDNQNDIPTDDYTRVTLYIAALGIGVLGIGYYLFKRKQRE